MSDYFLSGPTWECLCFLSLLVLCFCWSQWYTWNTEWLHNRWHLDHVWLLSSGDILFFSLILYTSERLFIHGVIWCLVALLRLPAEQNSDSSIWLLSDRHTVFKSHEECTNIPLVHSLVCTVCVCKTGWPLILISSQTLFI